MSGEHWANMKRARKAGLSDSGYKYSVAAMLGIKYALESQFILGHLSMRWQPSSYLTAQNTFAHSVQFAF